MTVVQILMLAVITGSPTPEHNMCELMWGRDYAAAPEQFKTARKHADSGRFEEAQLAFAKAAAELSEEANQLFAAEDGRAGARQMLDKLVTEEKTLAVRRDHFGVPAHLAAWGGYLACRAGLTDQGVLWLQMAWRDWGEKRTLNDAALLVLSTGDVKRASRFVKTVARTAVENSIKGIVLCLQGNQKDALWVFAEAEKAASKPHQKEAIKALAGKCKAGTLPVLPTRTP